MKTLARGDAPGSGYRRIPLTGQVDEAPIPRRATLVAA